MVSSKEKPGAGQSLDGSPDAAGSAVGGPVGGTRSSGLKTISQCPRAVIGDMCRVPAFGWDTHTHTHTHAHAHILSLCPVFN
jgi:hypothetical protein